MESLKPLLLFVVLGGVGYGVYVALNQSPPLEPVPRVAPIKNKATPPAAKSVRTPSPALPGPGPSASSPPAASTSPPTRANSLPFGIGMAGAQAAAAPPMAGRESAPPQLASDPIDRPPASATAERSSPPPNDAPAEADRARDEFASSLRYGQSLLAAGKLVEALRELSRWYDHPALSPPDQNQLVEILGQLAGTVIYSPDPWLGPPYVVQPGDTLEHIADGCQVPWQLLAKINGIHSSVQLNPGEHLKVIRGPFHAQLNLQQQWLALFVDGMYAGRFPVQGGRETQKPDGTYPVAKFAVDNPSNVARRPYVSLGGDLHLCVPDDAGTPGVGAVRINDRDMADVFDILSERSQVTVRR